MKNNISSVLIASPVVSQASGGHQPFIKICVNQVILW